MRIAILTVIVMVYMALNAGASVVNSDQSAQSNADSGVTFTLPQTHQVPEPGTLFLVALGMGYLISRKS